MNDRSAVDVIVEKALQAVTRQAAHSEFKLRTLFPKEEWATYSDVDRRLAGKKFKAAMQERTDMLSSGPNTANHQRYQSVGDRGNG